jgi:uncharacterized protein (TIGR01777 family)
MRVAVTGATGMIGRALVSELRERGDDVTALSRDAGRASASLGVPAEQWQDPTAEPAPAEALRGRDAVVHLLGETIAQRWTDEAKRDIRDSRVLGTRNLVEGLRAAEPRPRVLVSGSGSDYYGSRGDERVDESTPLGKGFLAGVTADWEAAARAAEELGVRVVTTRTGVVLSDLGGALAKMLPFFKAGVGGPVAGGRQYFPWIHVEDAAGAIAFLLDDERASGPVNLSTPTPVTNKELSKTLGRVLRRPALAPVPALALKVLYGEMAEVVTTGRRMVPGRLQELGYRFEHPTLENALRSVL